MSMTVYTVVYLEPVPAGVEQIVRASLPPELALRVRRASEPVAAVLADADFVLVATTPLPAAALAGARRLRLIQHQGVGYDKTDVAAAAAQGIPVALCPAGTSVGVAEHVFLLLLALYKQLRVAEAALRAGRFLQWELRAGSYELAGKTVGLVGLGRIGREVTVRARAFAANVIYYDVRRAAPEAELSLGVQFVPFAELLAQADILSLHLPLTPATRHVIGAAELGQMRRSALLINTARGPLVDEAALVAALQTGQIAGAGLDVFEAEPLPANHPLVALPNVVLTPHISAGTADALIVKMKACFANMLRVSRGEAPLDTVTPPQPQGDK
jgi:phosphoglycerate dehydrogenase-like enzyme